MYPASRQVGIGIASGLTLLMLAGCNPEDTEKDEAAESPAITAEATAEVTSEPDSRDIRIVRGPTLSNNPLLSDQAIQLPPPDNSSVPGLERQTWTVATYGNPAQLLAVPLRNEATPPVERPVRLALELFGGPAYSTALCAEGSWRLSVAAEAETSLVVYNASDAAIQSSVAYSLSDAYVWYESRPFVLKPGWNTVRIRQDTADFKTKSSNWQHIAGLWRPEGCRGITLLFHNGRRTGRFFIDSISVTEVRPSGTRPAQRPVSQSPK